jgi:predicted dehydrogenase
MLRIGIVGLGKMGLSHVSICNTHPEAKVAAICDWASYLRQAISKYSSIATFGSFERMIGETPLDAVIIATPSHAHATMVEYALEQGLHVFCEKPLTLSPASSERLARMARDRKLVTQVGYHYRFVGPFEELKRLVDSEAIGKVHFVTAEASGPLVLRPSGSTWRSKRSEGGGCLYDYAAHPINLLNWYFGLPTHVAATQLISIFSTSIEDAVYSTLFFRDGLLAHLDVNWSDSTARKMTTSIRIEGSQGQLYADRQELRAYLRKPLKTLGYSEGWNVRYATELTKPVWFYVRGEEYSAQIDCFIRRCMANSSEETNSFASAAETDQTIAMLSANARSIQLPEGLSDSGEGEKPRKRFWPFGRN